MNRNKKYSNATLVREFYCSVCWGALVERWNEEQRDWLVECPRGCKPRGFVTQEHVRIQREKDARDAREAAAAYPELAPAELKPSAEDVKRASKFLWGEDDVEWSKGG